MRAHTTADIILAIDVPSMRSVPAFTQSLVRITLDAAYSLPEPVAIKIGFLCKAEGMHYWVTYKSINGLFETASITNESSTQSVGGEAFFLDGLANAHGACYMTRLDKEVLEDFVNTWNDMSEDVLPLFHENKVSPQGASFACCSSATPSPDDAACSNTMCGEAMTECDRYFVSEDNIHFRNGKACSTWT